MTEHQGLTRHVSVMTESAQRARYLRSRSRSDAPQIRATLDMPPMEHRLGEAPTHASMKASAPMCSVPTISKDLASVARASTESASLASVNTEAPSDIRFIFTRRTRLYDSRSRVGLLVGVIAGAHQRAGLDMAETHLQGFFFEEAELVGRVQPRHGKVVLRRPQVLADGEDVHVVGREIAENLEQFVRCSRPGRP